MKNSVNPRPVPSGIKVYINGDYRKSGELAYKEASLKKGFYSTYPPVVWDKKLNAYRIQKSIDDEIGANIILYRRGSDQEISS